MPNLIYPRASGFTLIYNKEIYVFGGDTGSKNPRKRAIEKYNFQKN